MNVRHVAALVLLFSINATCSATCRFVVSGFEANERADGLIRSGHTIGSPLGGPIFLGSFAWINFEPNSIPIGHRVDARILRSATRCDELTLAGELEGFPDPHDVFLEIESPIIAPTSMQVRLYAPAFFTSQTADLMRVMKIMQSRSIEEDHQLFSGITPTFVGDFIRLDLTDADFIVVDSATNLRRVTLGVTFARSLPAAIPRLQASTACPTGLGVPLPTLAPVSDNQDFGPRVFDGAANDHKGVDYAVPSGTPILAMADGTATYGWSNTWGHYALVRHSHDDSVAVYAHLDCPNGQSAVRCPSAVDGAVSRGNVLGQTDNSGRSTGSHLHLELIPSPGSTVDRNDRRIDPVQCHMGCGASASCPAGTGCSSGRCEQICNTQLDCSDGAICLFDTHTCRRPTSNLGVPIILCQKYNDAGQLVECWNPVSFYPCGTGMLTGICPSEFAPIACTWYPNPNFCAGLGCLCQ